MAVAMSAEQFQQLMQGMQEAFRSQIGDSRSNTPASTTSTSAGNFSRCTTRFGGVAGERVDTFIDAISVYKDCVEITDENALKGLPMLLTGLAAEWWSGVKSTVTTFPDAMRDLRNAFGANKPAHQVYRELFAKEQDEVTTTDIFVCKARALLAQLPEPKLVESVQLDMVYGLLHRGIRKRVRREELLSFDDLLRLARTAEESFREKRRKEVNSETSSGKPTTSSKPATTEKRKERPRCTFCSNFGHEKADCRKLASQSASVPAPLTTTTSRPAVSCYGCGAPGVIRSQCAACKGKLAPSTATNTVSFNSLEMEVPRLKPRARPVLQVQIHGVTGTGYADTAAQQSVASHSLYEVLLNAGQVFEKTALVATLADGKPRTGEALLTTTDVTLQGRTVRTTFIVLPEARHNRTLLGIDFLTDAGVNLNVANQTWCFADDPQSVYQLHPEPAPGAGGACLDYVQISRPEEGEALELAQRQRLAGVIQANEDVFAQGGEPTSYTKHRIDPGDHPPISVPPHRLQARKKEVARRGGGDAVRRGDRRVLVPVDGARRPGSQEGCLNQDMHRLPQSCSRFFTDHQAARRSWREERDVEMGRTRAAGVRQIEGSTHHCSRAETVQRAPPVRSSDASSYATGAILLQGEGADERPVEYASRLLSLFIGSTDEALIPTRPFRRRGRPRKK